MRCEFCKRPDEECRAAAARNRCPECAQPGKTCQTLRPKAPGAGLCVRCWVDRYMRKA